MSNNERLQDMRMQGEAHPQNMQDPLDRLVRAANMPKEVALVALDLAKKHGLTIYELKNNGDGTIFVGVSNMTEDKGRGTAFDNELSVIWKKWQESSAANPTT